MYSTLLTHTHIGTCKPIVRSVIRFKHGLQRSNHCRAFYYLLPPPPFNTVHTNMVSVATQTITSNGPNSHRGEAGVFARCFAYLAAGCIGHHQSAENLNLFHRTHNSNRERQRATGTRGGQRAAGRPARYFPPAARYYKAGRTPLVM